MAQARDPAVIDAAVEQFKAYERARGFAERPILLDVLAWGWRAACAALALACVVWAFALPPDRWIDAEIGVALRPNWWAPFPAFLAGGVLASVGFFFLPCAVSPWIREAMAWRVFGRGRIRANVAGLLQTQGGARFDPGRALRNDDGLHRMVWALPLGALLIGVGAWIQILAERDIHMITADGFSTTDFWTSRVTHHSVQALTSVTFDCSPRATGRRESADFAIALYQFRNGHSTELRLRPSKVEDLVLISKIDAQLRAARVPVRFDASYSRGCILGFTEDRDPDFVRAFDQVMHFAEWRKAQGEP